MLRFLLLFLLLSMVNARAGGMEHNHDWTFKIGGHHFGLEEDRDTTVPRSHPKATFTTIVVAKKRLRIHYPIEIVAAGIIGLPALLVVGFAAIRWKRKKGALPS